MSENLPELITDKSTYKLKFLVITLFLHISSQNTIIEVFIIFISLNKFFDLSSALNTSGFYLIQFF